MNGVVVTAAFGARRQNNQADGAVAIAATFIPGNDEEAAIVVSGICEMTPYLRRVSELSKFVN